MKETGFSIVIPSHNRPALILNAVQSALKNCTAHSEVIVVDDRSTIPVADILHSITDSRLKSEGIIKIIEAQPKRGI